MLIPATQQRHNGPGFVPPLFRHRGEIHRPGIQSGRRSCFQPPHPRAQLAEAICQSDGRLVTHTPTRAIFLTYVHLPVEECARCQHYRFSAKDNATASHHTRNGASRQLNILHGVLKQIDAIGLLQR